MAKVTMGTALYVLVPTVSDPTTNEVMKVECIKEFDLGSQSASQIDITCLEAWSREYLQGLKEPGTSTFNIDADPEMSSHVRLFQLFDPKAGESSPNFKFALGWGDGTAAPTIDASGDDFDLPATRTWIAFQGYISDFPFNFQVASTVATTVSVQRSGGVQWIPKSA